MSRLVRGLLQSLAGYIAGSRVDRSPAGRCRQKLRQKERPPSARVFRHFTEHVRSLTGMLYGRRMYEVMRHWEEATGAAVASVLSAAGMVDEYRLYYSPHVLVGGKPYFAGLRVPGFRLTKHELIGDDVVRLVYAPA